MTHPRLMRALLSGVAGSALLLGMAACDDKTSAASIASPQRSPPETRSSADTQVVAQGPKVAFLGDSIAAGLHLDAEQAFPALVQDTLRAQQLPFRLVNAGVSGDTSAGGLRRVDWLLKQRPDIVVVELGGNDGLRGMPVQEIANNLRAIVDKIKAAGAQTLLLGVVLPPSYGANYTRSFAAIYPALAAQLQVPFCPYFMEHVAGVPDKNLEDGLHPTAEGHRMIAARVAAALSPLVASASARAPAR